MSNTKSIGYTPSTYDIQFINVLSDLQSAELELAMNESKLETILNLTKGWIWKIKAKYAGVPKSKRDFVTKQMQLIFNVNPLYFNDKKQEMYNEGGRQQRYSAELRNLLDKSETNVLTAGDRMLLTKLQIENEMLKKHVKYLEEQAESQKKLLEMYENFAKISAK
jgi:hypothetical protein